MNFPSTFCAQSLYFWDNNSLTWSKTQNEHGIYNNNNNYNYNSRTPRPISYVALFCSIYQGTCIPYLKLYTDTHNTHKIIHTILYTQYYTHGIIHTIIHTIYTQLYTQYYTHNYTLAQYTHHNIHISGNTVNYVAMYVYTC